MEPDIYGLVGLSHTSFLIFRILDYNQYPEMVNALENDDAVKTLTRTGFLIDAPTFLKAKAMIDQYAK